MRAADKGYGVLGPPTPHPPVTRGCFHSMEWTPDVRCAEEERWILPVWSCRLGRGRHWHSGHLPVSLSPPGTRGKGRWVHSAFGVCDLGKPVGTVSSSKFTYSMLSAHRLLQPIKELAIFSSEQK